MVFTLQKGIRVCISGEQIILLDLRTERYCGLSRSYNDAFYRWLTNQPIAEREEECLERLVLKGILCPAGQEPSRPEPRTPDPLVPAIRIDTTLVRPSRLGVIEAIASRLVWAWRVKHWRLKRQLHYLAKLERRAKTPRPGAMRAIVRAFETADLILGSHDKCMERSFALVSICRRHGLPVAAVLGVQSSPFAAHCWVQDGEIVLNEEPDRVQLFTPILVT